MVFSSEDTKRSASRADSELPGRRTHGDPWRHNLPQGARDPRAQHKHPLVVTELVGQAEPSQVCE
jgi:hypothetical protein